MPRWVLLLVPVLTIFSIHYILASTTNVEPYINKLLTYLNDKVSQIESQISDNNTQLFLAIFTGSIAILSIVFSISQFTISQLSNYYSPYILEKYKNSLRFRFTFYLFSGLILFSLALSISVFSNFFIRSIALILFGSGVFLLILHFKLILTLMDPKRLSQLLLTDIEHNITQGKTEEIKKYIISMGDIATKSLVRKEEKIVLEYIDAFHELFKKYLRILDKLKEEKEDKSNIIEKLRPEDMFYEIEDVVCRNLYDHLERVFLTALNNKEKRVTTEIALKLYDFTRAILERGDEVLFRQLIDTRRVKGAAYYHFFKNAMEYKDYSKEIFVRNMVSILQHYLIFKAKLNQKLLNELVDVHLFRMNKLIIDFDDFDLFKKELSWISRMILKPDPKELLKDAEVQLNKLLSKSKYIDKINCSDIEYLNIYLEHRLLRNFDAVEEFKKELLECLKSVSEDWKTDEEFEKIQRILEEYRTLARLYRTFFLIGAYILFCGQNKGINWKKYVKTLWELTTPPDAGANYLNKTPVCFDPLWLIYLLTYGGKNNTSWFEEYDFELEDYHEIGDYVYQYWVLLMGKWSKDLDLPNESLIMNWKRSSYDFKLKIWYELCNNFLHHKDQIKENFQKILQERLYEGIYTEDKINKLKAKFDELVWSMEKTLQMLQQ